MLKTSSVFTALPVPVSNGGTGQSSLPVNYILLGNGLSPIASLAPGAANTILSYDGTNYQWITPSSGGVTSVGMTVPAFLSVSPSSITTSGTFAVTLSGTALPVANGGTGLTSGTSGGVLYYSATGTLTSSAALTANAIVLGGGAGVAPSTTTTGTGVVTALGVNVGSAGAFVVNGGVLGTPSSGTLTNATGLPVSTGISGFGTGVATALGTNVGSAGAFVVNGGALGTPSSGTLTNATGLPIDGGTTGTLPVSRGGSGQTSYTDGQLLIGNSTGNTLTKATLTQGSGITITNGSGTITIANASPMTYPGAGIPNSTGSAWGTSYSTTGSGTVVALATSPSFTTPTLGVASATTINKVTITAPATGSTLTIADGKTLTVNNSITLAGTDATVMTFPSTSQTIAGLGNAQTFSNTNTFYQINFTVNTVTVSANAGTVPITYRLNNFTNSSAAAMTITMATASAVDGQMSIVRIYDFSAAAQTINWVNTENSTVTAPTTSNGSTTLPLTVGFMYNSATSKWRCIASA